MIWQFARRVNPKNALSIAGRWVAPSSTLIASVWRHFVTSSSVWVKKIIRRVAGFVARYRRRDFFLPRWRIVHFAEDGVRLSSDILDLGLHAARWRVLLARDSGQARIDV